MSDDIYTSTGQSLDQLEERLEALEEWVSRHQTTLPLREHAPMRTESPALPGLFVPGGTHEAVEAAAKEIVAFYEESNEDIGDLRDILRRFVSKLGCEHFRDAVLTEEEERAVATIKRHRKAYTLQEKADTMGPLLTIIARLTGAEDSP